MDSALARASTFLFVPASRPERFAKALDCGADCVIVDLEDAVAPERKADARAQLAQRLAGFARPQLARTLVRINAPGSAWYDEDVRLLGEWTSRGLAGAMLPKAQSPAVLQSLAAALDPQARLLPLVESLAGLDAASLLARAPQVARLAFGHLDFQLDLGMHCGPQEAELAPARFALVAASRRAQVAPPVDGVTVDTADSERLAADTRRARSFGFGGKLCIHPSQVAAVQAVFAPSAEELAWARRVVSEAEARNGAAFSLEGRMVDLPVVRRARETLQHAGNIPA
jgi:citrate lyase subunit beta / citryl-CoA lyase